jgi:hypothetical protein
MKQSFITIIFTFLIINTIYCQNNATISIYPEIIGLAEFDISKNSEKWFELNRSYDRKYYIDENGNITIKKEENISEHSLEINGGRLIGTNHGEWGGNLIFEKNGKQYPILKGNIVGLFIYKNDIYVLEGLSHLSLNSGQIIKLKKDFWQTELPIDISIKLAEAPAVYTIYKDTLYIIGSNIIMFDGKKLTKIIQEENFWGRGLYPESIFVNDKIIAVGMRGCVAIINKEDFSVKAYKK